MDYYPLSAVRVCLFYIFADNTHIGGRSSIRNMQTRHVVVTDPLIAVLNPQSLSFNSHAHPKQLLMFWWPNMTYELE
jgi:hypothetical protein